MVAIATVFLPIGIVLLTASNSVHEVVQRYDDVCTPLQPTCTLHIHITEDMSPPIMAYYQLTNFHQNQRLYVKSRSDDQLANRDNPDLSFCKEYGSLGGKVLYPCGLIAHSMFNDTFQPALCPDGNCTAPQPLTGQDWLKDGIAWSSDKEYKFKQLSDAEVNARGWTRVDTTENRTLPAVSDEDLIVWMRTAGLSDFRKLYRRITNQKLRKGDIVRFTIENNFPMDRIGEKAIVLSTMTWIGARNPFLGATYIAVGGLCVILAAIFSIKQHVSPRQLGNLALFSWAEAVPMSDAPARKSE